MTSAKLSRPIGSGTPIQATEQVYAEWLATLKQRIQEARLRASLAVNAELVQLYWQIGTEILQRQEQQGWGAKVVERLAKDLKQAFPEMKGFSRANLMYMRTFAATWSKDAIVQQAVGQLTMLEFAYSRSFSSVLFPTELKVCRSFLWVSWASLNMRLRLA